MQIMENEKHQTYIRVRHDMWIAAAQLRLLIFAALNGAGGEAVILVDLDVVLLGKATIPLLHAHVFSFGIVLNVLDCQLTSMKN